MFEGFQVIKTNQETKLVNLILTYLQNGKLLVYDNNNFLSLETKIIIYWKNKIE